MRNYVVTVIYEDMSEKVFTFPSREARTHFTQVLRGLPGVLSIQWD